MPSFSQRGLKICPKCKIETEKKRCPKCGAATKGSGTWTVRFRFTDDTYTTKNMRLSGFATKAEANEAYLTYLATHKKYEPKSGSVTTYQELRDEFLAHARLNVKESTYTRLDRTIKAFLDPTFHGKTIKQITPVLLTKWQDELTEKGFSYNYRKNIRSALFSMFEYGKLHNISNPLRFVPGFKNKEIKREMLYWTEEEFGKFYAEIDDLRFQAVFAFLYLTGCRKGEALGLQWKAVDLSNKSVKIYQTISHDTLDGKYKLTSPKTKNGTRTVPIPSSLCGLLKELFESQQPKSDDFVFGKGNIPMPFQTLLNRFTVYIKRSGVKRIRLHDLRHSHVSLLINKGENDLSTAYVIAKRIGDSVEQIYKTYGHLFPDQQNHLLKKLEFDL